MSKSRNIVLVDDDQVTIQVCNMVFKRTIPFATIFVFESGLEAMDWIENGKGAYDQGDNFILLLDLNMPVLNGWGFLDLFKKLDEAIRQKFSIHILTSSVDEKDVERSSQYSSVKGFHSKPITHKMIEEIFAEEDIFLK